MWCGNVSTVREGRVASVMLCLGGCNNRCCPGTVVRVVGGQCGTSGINQSGEVWEAVHGMAVQLTMWGQSEVRVRQANQFVIGRPGNGASDVPQGPGGNWEACTRHPACTTSTTERGSARSRQWGPICSNRPVRYILYGNPWGPSSTLLCARSSAEVQATVSNWEPVGDIPSVQQWGVQVWDRHGVRV